MKFRLKLFIFFALFFISLQVFQTDKSVPIHKPESEFVASAEVLKILEKSCYDCHSYKTQYPFYAYIFPISSFLTSHIMEAREELNFSTWGEYSVERKLEKLDEIIEEIENKEMPILSYRILHPESQISGDELTVLRKWVQEFQDKENERARKNSN